MAAAMVATGRKKCRFGKSCASTCISKTYFCIVELGPEIAAMLKEARANVHKQFGKKDTRERTGYISAGLNVNKAEALAKEYKNLPKNDPRREEIRKKIVDLGFKVGSIKGYDDLRIRMRNPNFDINKHYD